MVGESSLRQSSWIFFSRRTGTQCRTRPHLSLILSRSVAIFWQLLLHEKKVWSASSIPLKNIQSRDRAFSILCPPKTGEGHNRFPRVFSLTTDLFPVSCAVHPLLDSFFQESCHSFSVCCQFLWEIITPTITTAGSVTVGWDTPPRKLLFLLFVQNTIHLLANN